MAIVFGHRWSSQYGEAFAKDRLSDAAGVWIDGLSHLTLGMVSMGIDKLATSRNEWPPSLPEFVNWCRPTADELRIPGVDIAYHDAAKGNWSHPIVWHAAKEIGFYEVSNNGASVTRKRFEKAYMKLVEEARDGRVFKIEQHDGPVLVHQPQEVVKDDSWKGELDALMGRGGDDQHGGRV